MTSARRLPPPKVALRPYGEGDLGLLRALLGDAEMMRFLGGAESEEALALRHARYLSADPEANGLFVILAGDERIAAGWVGFWVSEWQGEQTWECGWNVLPDFQGRGIASAAARLALDEARARGAHRPVDAFPSVGNDASNALCRHLGFKRLGEVEVEYPKGRMMRAVHWRLDLEKRADKRVREAAEMQAQTVLGVQLDTLVNIHADDSHQPR